MTIRVTTGEMPLLNRILTYETLESGSAPAGGRSGMPGLTNVGPNPAGPIALADAASILGRDAVWAGADLHGFALDSVQKLSFRPRPARSRP